MCGVGCPWAGASVSLVSLYSILKIMKKIIQTLSKAVQVVLAAPVVLPAKVVQVVKYVAVALGILETVIRDEAQQPQAAEEGGDETDL